MIEWVKSLFKKEEEVSTLSTLYRYVTFDIEFSRIGESFNVGWKLHGYSTFFLSVTEEDFDYVDFKTRLMKEIQTGKYKLKTDFGYIRNINFKNLDVVLIGKLQLTNESPNRRRKEWIQ